MMPTARAWGAVTLIIFATLTAGCGGALLVAYTGGGLPPGEPDLGGIVVASVDASMATTQVSQPAQDDVPPGTEPVAGAEVTLMRGRSVVGRATTGEGGYFRFENPATGSYTIDVTPPAGSTNLRGAQRQVTHTRGRRTFVTIQLEREQQGNGPGPGAGG